ncbi:MAG: hypothetical protein AMJ59_10065 [Gammaproteobacteria bacterium SG8_31]|nr:MAG: hypothetical protein AMJ59_10065 [Gammaproteobacteria bacterium SG8_31]
MGKTIMIIGLAVLVFGAVMTWAPWLLTWFGRLPGDIRIQRPSGTIFIPLVSMLVLSIALTLIVNFLFRR